MKTYIRNIYFSRSFHRLAGKTQLYSNYDNDHFHNRLTHTIEVMNIANGIWDVVNKSHHSSDVIVAIALAHDLGHTPFGHAGERALNDITYQIDLLNGVIVPSLTNKIIFKHNYYSAKVALGIDSNKKRIDRVLAGIISHTNLDYGSKCTLSKEQKESTISFYLKNYPRRTKTIRFVNKNTIESQIVALADEIAQRLSDMHDLLLSKDYLIDNEELIKMLPSDVVSSLDGFPETFKIKKIIELLGTFYVNGVYYCNPSKTLKMKNEQQNSMDYIKDIVNNKIKDSKRIHSFDKKADRVVKVIFKKLYMNPSWIDQKMMFSIFDRIVTICDSFNGVVEVKKFFPKFKSNLRQLDEKNKILFLKKIYKIVHSKKAMELKGKENVFIKEINSELVYSIVFYIANMTDRFANEKYKQVNSVKKYLKFLLT